MPDIAHDLGIAPGHAAALVLVAFHALALVVEAPLLAWCERFSIRRVSATGLVVLAVACGAAAYAHHAWTLVLALALYGPASGCALAASEGALIEARPDERERTTARIGLAGSLGDLAVPVILASLASVGLGWRSAFLLAAFAALALAWVQARTRDLDRPLAAESDDGPTPSLRDALRTALASRPLLAWAFAAALTTLLDEILVAFAVVHLAQLGATPFQRSVALAVWILAGLAGLTTLERIALRVDPVRAAIVSSVACAIAIVALALARSPALGIVAMACVGASGAMLHPLAKARAYSALPGRPAVVSAIESTFALLDLVAPVGLGVLAAHAGGAAAVTALLVAPVGVAVIAYRQRRAAAPTLPRVGGE